MSKQTIAVDIDDVLASINEAMRLFINKQYSESHTPEDYTVDGEYWAYWEAIWNVPDSEATERVEAFLRSDAFHQAGTHEGAVDVIDRLKDKYELVVVTARQDYHVEKTHDWLNSQFGDTFKRIEFVHVWSKDKEFTKGQICKVIGAEYLIDDNVEHCNLAAEEGVQALLFGDYGWNRKKKLHENAHRVKSWHEVAEYFGV